MIIHWVSTGEKSNPKPNPIVFGAPNPKTVSEKSPPNPNLLDPKHADTRPEPAPLPCLITWRIASGRPRKTGAKSSRGKGDE